MTKPSIYLFRYHGNEHMDPHFSVCFLTWYGISFKKNLGSLNYYGPKKSSVNVASILKIAFQMVVFALRRRIILLKTIFEVVTVRRVELWTGAITIMSDSNMLC